MYIEREKRHILVIFSFHRIRLVTDYLSRGIRQVVKCKFIERILV